MTESWIGVDLDGTLAHYTVWEGETVIGDPVPSMVERVVRWRSEGYTVKIMTARVADPTDLEGTLVSIRAWSKKHLGEILPLTCKKDMGMICLWDDRCVAIETNTGKVLGGLMRA